MRLFRRRGGAGLFFYPAHVLFYPTRTFNREQAVSVYYNEWDKKAAAWLRELIKEGHIADGIVDERSITDIKPHELNGYTQHHFFAGVGGWSTALRLIGWPDDQPIWTGSAPCQPFSSAGKGLAQEDPRHLWPAFFGLIQQCRPDFIAGEQVESAIGHGWLDGISADLEGEKYAIGSEVLGAHSVGSPHIRQRLYWMAHSQEFGWRKREQVYEGSAGGIGSPRIALSVGSSDDSDVLGMGQPDSAGRHPRQHIASTTGHGDSIEPAGSTGRLGHPDLSCGDERPRGGEQSVYHEDGGTFGSTCFWGNFDVISCADGKSRRIESGVQPLAHGVSGRVGLLRGYGNAIVPQVAAVFIEEAIKAINDCYRGSLVTEEIW